MNSELSSEALAAELLRLRAAGQRVAEIAVQLGLAFRRVDALLCKLRKAGIAVPARRRQRPFRLDANAVDRLKALAAELAGPAHQERPGRAG